MTCKDTRRMSPQSLETPLNSILSDAGHDGRLPNSNLSFGNWPDNLAGPVSLSQASGVVVDTKTRPRPRPVGESVAHPQMTNIPDATDMFLSAPGSSSASGKNKPLLIQDFVSKVTAKEDENVIQLGQNVRLSVNVGHINAQNFRIFRFQIGMLLIIKFYFTLLKQVDCQQIVTLNQV